MNVIDVVVLIDLVVVRIRTMNVIDVVVLIDLVVV